MWAREAGKGGESLGGAPESSVGATRRSLVPPFGLFLTIGLIWLVTRGGGVGGVGQGGGQGGGEMGGGTREQCGSNKAFTGLIWLVTRGGGVGGVGQGGGQGGGDGGSRGVGGEVERVDKMWRPLKGEPAGRRPQGSADYGDPPKGYP